MFLSDNTEVHSAVWKTDTPDMLESAHNRIDHIKHKSSFQVVCNAYFSRNTKILQCQSLTALHQQWRMLENL